MAAWVLENKGIPVKIDSRNFRAESTGKRGIEPRRVFAGGLTQSDERGFPVSLQFDAADKAGHLANGDVT